MATMNYRPAKPGKPGEWNGRKQRWRSYVRTFKAMDPNATARLAEKEIALKEKAVRRLTAIRAARVLALVTIGAALLLLWWRWYAG